MDSNSRKITKVHSSRYVKEWLSTMATAEIIEVNEDERFWIKKENIEVRIKNLNKTMNTSNCKCPLYQF